MWQYFKKHWWKILIMNIIVSSGVAFLSAIDGIRDTHSPIVTFASWLVINTFLMTFAFYRLQYFEKMNKSKKE